MTPVIKLEWGNLKHINLVRNYDERMRGISPCRTYAEVVYCKVKILDDLRGTPMFYRTKGITTRHKHALIECPRCFNYLELVFSDEYADSYEWEWCGCGIEFELRKEFCQYQMKEIEKVFVKQEEQL